MLHTAHDASSFKLHLHYLKETKILLFKIIDKANVEVAARYEPSAKIVNAAPFVLRSYSGVCCIFSNCLKGTALFAASATLVY